MRQMIKFVKPFYPLIFCAVLLLFVQAMCDLNLPNYMSNIVNVGIQQYGVEDAAPDAISGEGLGLISLVMPEEVRADFTSNYEVFAGGSTRDVKIALGRLNSEYKGELYVLKSGADKAALNNTFSRAATAFFAYAQGLAKSSGVEVASSVEAGMSVDISQILNMIGMFSVLPDGSWWEQAGEQAELVSAQTGVILTRMLYTQLGADMTAIQRAYIIRTGLYMLGIALLSGGAAITVGFLASRIGAGTARKLRNVFFRKVESFTNAEMDKFQTASLITRCTNDILQIQIVFSMGIRFIFFSPIMAVGGVIMALGKSTSMSWIIALACVVIIGLIATVLVIAMPKFQMMQKLIDKLNLVAREGLSGLMVIRAFNTEEHEQGRFDTANRDLAKTSLFVNRIMAFMMPVMMLVMNGVSILVMWVGAHQIASSSLQVGDMMAFIQYLTQILMAFMMISMMFFMFPGRVSKPLY